MKKFIVITIVMLVGSACFAATWKKCELCGCDYVAGEYKCHLMGSAHNPPLDAYPKIFYNYPPQILIDKLRVDSVERDKFLKWRRLYEYWWWFGGGESEELT